MLWETCGIWEDRSRIGHRRCLGIGRHTPTSPSRSVRTSCQLAKSQRVPLKSMEEMKRAKSSPRPVQEAILLDPRGRSHEDSIYCLCSINTMLGHRYHPSARTWLKWRHMRG